MVYPALLPLMHTPRLPVVDWTDVPADLNGLVRFAERRNLVSVRVPSHFNWPLPGHYWRVKLQRTVVHGPPSTSAEVKERAGLCIYSPFWAFMACYRVWVCTKIFTSKMTQCTQKLIKMNTAIGQRMLGWESLFPIEAMPAFVNRSVTDWDQLQEGATGTSHGKKHIFKTRVRKVKTSEGKWRR